MTIDIVAGSTYTRQRYLLGIMQAFAGLYRAEPFLEFARILSELLAAEGSCACQSKPPVT